VNRNSKYWKKKVKELKPNLKGKRIILKRGVNRSGHPEAS